MRYNSTVSMAKYLLHNKYNIDLSKKLDINDYFKPKLKMFNPASDLTASYSEQKS